MTVFPGLPPIQSNPVTRVPRQQDRARVKWDLWRSYTASPHNAVKHQAQSGQRSMDPNRGQRFDAYA